PGGPGAAPSGARPGRGLMASRTEPSLERTGRLAAELEEREVDVLLVTAPVNVRYLTSFTGSHGLALIARDGGLGDAARGSDGAWQLVPCNGMVERLRSVKEPGEVERIRAAAELADEALRATLEAGIVGRTEREVAIEIELRMRRLGATAPSFSSIVAAGANG